MTGGREKAADKFATTFGTILDEAGRARDGPQISAIDAGG
jgi:hypothetical protein